MGENQRTDSKKSVLRKLIQLRKLLATAHGQDTKSVRRMPMALRADERRDKLRKASGRGKYSLIRRCLNGETYMDHSMYPYANP